MAFHLRKLLTKVVITGSCCSDITNPDASCPLTCYICPPCAPLIIVPPPPLPPPPPPLYIPYFLSPPEKPHKLYILVATSLAVLATAFFLFTCYTIYRFYSNWRNSRPRQSRPDDGPDDFLDEEVGPVVDHPIWYIRTIGLQPSVISAITIVKYKRGDGLVEGTDCSVCLNEFEEDESLRLLPKCNHAFHIPCIDTWLRSHTNCPLCRAGIVNNTAGSSTQLLIVQNSGLPEEARLESNREVGRDSENESPELRFGIDENGLSRSQSGLKINGELDGVLPMRRSVSMDSLSASMIKVAVANAFPGQSDGNPSNQSDDSKDSGVEVGMNQTGSSNMKRSVSCNAKVLLSRHSSRNRNSGVPQ